MFAKCATTGILFLVNTKTLIAALVVVVLLAGTGLYIFTQPKNLTPLTEPTSQTPKDTKPSETSITYSDPSGFSFDYPDNLSISNLNSGESADPDSYANLQLFSKDVSGSLNLKISDTKLKTLNEWIKSNNISDSNKPIEKKLGELSALEVKTNDRIMLAALDKGILFTVEVPKIEENFWNPVYDKITSGFTFAQPEVAVASTNSNASVTSGEEVQFEGEEVIE